MIAVSEPTMTQGPRQIPSAVSDVELAKLQELARGQLVLELGAHLGFSTVVLAQVARLVHSVDWHRGDAQVGDGDSLQSFVANLGQHSIRDRVVVHVGRFDEVLDVFRPSSFGLCFLDGEHGYEAVTRDTWRALPLVKAGGVFCWHDYGRFEVQPAVDALVALLERQRGVMQWLETVEHLAWIRL